VKTLAIAAALSLAVVGSVQAQTFVGDSTENGMHWHIAAPEGASWRMECRFRPVIYQATPYERRWINKISQPGQGSLLGRLPDNDGYCRVTKTGGPGPIGIAIVRGGEVVAEGVARVGETASVGLL
jgi:hypothetical protein